MRLLILTQAVDKNDPVLGFFHGWLEEFSKHYEQIYVICLKEEKHSLPANVTVYSLGKERVSRISYLVSRIKYTLRFYKYIWFLRKEYDAVFVHMNQEYVLLGGLLWRILGKRVFLWRNHYAGSIWTDIAVALSSGVFCTSKFSYTARYKKTVIMPVGVDANVFKPLEVERDPAGILFLARMAPSKKPHILLEALKILLERGISFRASFYGSALPADSAYYVELQEKARTMGLSKTVHFYAGIPNSETPRIYNKHTISVNCSSSGMYDKTIFEAAACGCLVVAASRDFAIHAGERFTFPENNARALADALKTILSLTKGERDEAKKIFRALAEENSLKRLAERVSKEMS